ncbi:MAG: hypothetical protein GXP17_07795 [Gammaproteobacteria bacterium]|nr:hypothetical protein [Gammaproteobacteria bacterium]
MNRTATAPTSPSLSVGRHPGPCRGSGLISVDNLSAAPLRRATQDQAHHRQQSSSRPQAEHVRVEISADKLRELVNAGALCAADVHCLDCESKQCVWQVCLRACMAQLTARRSSLV